jgi:hypothetical protein
MKKILILIICIAGLSHKGHAQHEVVDNEIKRLLDCSCDFHGCDENMDIIMRDLAYSAQASYLHFNDTTPCVKLRMSRLLIRMLNRVDSSNFDAVFQHCLYLARDTSIDINYYNSIVEIVRNKLVRDGIEPPSAVMQFIGTQEFYKASTPDIPLLVSYLDRIEEVDNLKQWENKNQPLKAIQQEYLLVALMRLGDKTATKKFIAINPTDNNFGLNWRYYLIGLNYARTIPATKRLIELLNSKEHIKCIPKCYGDDPSTHYSTVRTFALQQLSHIVENFPFEVDIPYNWDTHFSDLPEEDFKKAKRWFKDNPNYKIIRKSNYNY